MSTPTLLSPQAAAQLFDPDRLRQARLAGEWTQKGLAASVGLTPAAISQFEHGHTRPSPETLAALAAHTGYALTYFTAGRPTTPNSTDGWHFRSLSSTSKRQRDRAAILATHVWELAIALTRNVRFPTVTIPALPTSESSAKARIAAAAAEARRCLNLGPGPVADVVRSVEAGGVVTARLATDLPAVDGFSRVLPEFPVMVLGTEKNDAARSRFDAAHELGHLVMHRQFKGSHRTKEQQANAFAAEFLAPAEEIGASLPADADFAALAKLKRIWGMSMASLLYRSRELGVMSDAKYRRAVTRMQQLGWRQSEPVDLGPPEEPQLLATALQLVADRGITIHQIAAQTALPLDLVQRIAGEPPTEVFPKSATTGASGGGQVFHGRFA